VANELVGINGERTLTPDQSRDLAGVPPELEWLANITNAKTRRFDKSDVSEFLGFAGLKDFTAIRSVARAHVIARRKDIESRSLAPTTIRRKLTALSSLPACTTGARRDPKTARRFM
jgi:hypothetical protein